MANLTIRNQWENTIPQIETGDRVIGGTGGKINQIFTQLANRSEFNKSEIARAIALIGTNQQTATQQFALKTTSLTAGAGLSGGGVLRDNMTLSLGTPSKITATSQNSAVSNTHTHEIDKASTSVAGIVQLSSALNSEAENLAATPKAVKAAFDRASLIIIDNTRDANQIVTDGIPYALCNVNTPKAGYWYVINVRYGTTGNVGQMAWQYLPNQPQELWTRAKYGSTWGAWTRIDGADWGDIRNNPLSIRTQNPSVDANGLKTDGIYAFGSGGLNLPTTTGAYHVVVTAGSNASWCRQTAYKAYSNERYVRTLTSANGNWGAWVRDDGVAWADIRDKPNTFSGYGITGSQSLSGSIELTNAYPAVVLKSTAAGTTKKWLFEASADNAYFAQRDSAANSGGVLLNLPTRAGTLALDGDVVKLSGNQTINGEKTFANRLTGGSEIHAGGVIKTSYNHDWVGFIANQQAEGKNVYFDCYVRNICRGSYQIVSEGSGKYSAKICITPSGTTNSDRRVVGLTVQDNAIHSHAYGWLHEGFIRNGIGAGQQLGHQISLGWSGSQLKAQVDNSDLGNLLFENHFIRTYYPNHYQGAEVYKIKSLNLMIIIMKAEGLPGFYNLPEAFDGLWLVQASDRGGGNLNVSAQVIDENRVKAVRHSNGSSVAWGFMCIGFKRS